MVLSGLYFLIKKYCKKTARYINIIFKYNAIILFCVSAIVSNTYLLYLNNEYNKIYKNNTCYINNIAVVISEKNEKEYVNYYVIKMKNGTYKNKEFIASLKKSEKQPEYGDLIEIKGEYIAPEKARNYKGFDYSNYLKTKGIYGTINRSNIKILNKREISPLLILSNNIRNSIITKANNLLPQKTSSLLTGILLGDKGEISEETIESFRKSSLSHILAVSGMHVSFIILRNKLYFI